MFVLRVVDKYDLYNYIVGYSEDQAKLEDMIAQFESATHLLAFEDCPETIEFGNVLLTKDSIDSPCYKWINSSNKRLAISYGDILEIEEVCPI